MPTLTFVCLALTTRILAAASILPAEFKNAVQPWVTSAGSNLVYVAFGTKEEGGIYCLRSTNDGASFEFPNRVGQLKSLALGMRRGPRIVAQGNQVFLSAISHEEGNLYFWSSSDQGMSWSRKKNLNTVTNSAREGLHAMAGDGKSKIFLAWLDLRNRQTELWGALSLDNSKTWEPNVLIYRSPAGNICECCHPSVMFSPKGDVVAMWRNWDGSARDMYWTSSQDGKTFEPGKILGTGRWVLKGCPMDGGAMVPVSTGRVLTVWRRETSIIAAYADALGLPGVTYKKETGDKSIFASNPAGEELRLSGNGMQPVVVVGVGEPDIFWMSGSKVMHQRGLKPDTAMVFAENAAYPSATVLPGNNATFIVWESSEGGRKTILGQKLP